jgi:hypothetical protein
MILKSFLVEAAARLSTYASNDEPPTAATNKAAPVLAANTAFYRMYVVGVAGSEGMPAPLMTLFAFPFFGVACDLTSLSPAWKGNAIFRWIGQHSVLYLVIW